MKIPTNGLGLPGLDTDPAHTDTQRIMPDLEIPRPSHQSICTWIALGYTDQTGQKPGWHCLRVPIQSHRATLSDRKQ